jgi:hypothetical protein
MNVMLWRLLRFSPGLKQAGAMEMDAIKPADGIGLEIC